MRILLAALLMLALAPPQPSRPRILGLSHIGVFVSDLARARVFYTDLLGFDEAFTLPGAGGPVDAAFVKINDRQWIELLDRPTDGNGQLDHVALYTDSAEGMRAYLGSRGIAVPERIATAPDGNRTFRVKDPDGHTLELSTSPTASPAATPGAICPRRVCRRRRYTPASSSAT